MSRRLGVFGGSFDPPHLGHRALCEAARDALSLDRVEVLPVAKAPHGKHASADPWHRWAMTVLAFRDAPGLVPSPRELQRGGTSYTVETLRELRREHPGDEIHLVIGGDSYDDLPTWYCFEEIVASAHLAVVDRPGAGGTERLRPEDATRVLPPGDSSPPDGHAVFAVPMEPLHWAARDIRRQLAAGEQAQGLDGLVYDYIRNHGLYRR